ncbi:hypothetical protein OAG28_00710 [Akkermansiaceae bacterium]|nr:hypothetical protein [Akkermansiaceae bacterium]MDB4271940.1 hypothetical protein [Akkermansiaceae bacterium]MDB4332588.1 hypothetical protein [Akkermansiaceae bacterium]MDB4781627.1 hypothetical protein [Akkermansiaceae bacterium]
MNLRSRKGLQKFVDEQTEGIAFLRFETSGLKQSRTSDWDIAVRDRKHAMAACESLYGEAWMRIPRHYVIQHFYQWGQCDLLPVFEWNGVEYLSQERFWADVEKGEDGMPRPALGHDAYIAWMTGLLWGRRFDRRYTDFITQAAKLDTERFREALDTAFGSSLGKDLYLIAERGDAAVATHWVGKMRFMLRLRMLAKEPIKTIRTIISHWCCEWKFHRRLALPWIGLLGPDGSGKSTVIDNVTEGLRLSRLKILTIHWLPKLSLTPIPNQPAQTVTDPHSQPPKSAILSWLQLVKVAFFWWWASFRYLIHLRAKKEIILSDRFYPDLLADPKRYRYGASPKLAQLAFKLLPKPDKLIVLLTSPEKILARKKEVSKEELERQLTNYREVARQWGDRAIIVDCGKEVEAVAEDVFNALLEELRERSR